MSAGVTEVAAEDVEALLDLDEEEFALVVAETPLGPEGDEDWLCFIDGRVVGRTVPAMRKLILAVTQRRAELYEVLNAEADRDTPRAKLVREAKREVSRLTARLRDMGIRMGQANEVQKRANAAMNAAQREAKFARFGGADKYERQLAHIKRSDREISQLRFGMRVLALAIQRHRLAALAAGLDPEPADRRLWALLDEVEVPLRTEMVTLTEMLGSGTWTEETPP